MHSQPRHPEDDQLLRYADGELTARQSRKIQSHLQACWECRVQLEELQKVVGECVRYRRNVLDPLLPPAPTRWNDDLSGQFAEIDRSLARSARLSAIRQARTWIPIAAVLLLAWGLYYQLHHTPSVQASELLQKAVAAADSRPVKPHLIRVRTRRQTVVRVTGVKSISAETTPIATLFQSAHYNWDDPLSASSFIEWRSHLPDKHDEVTTGDSGYRIRTSTESGELAQATLELRRDDLRPVQGRLEFRNRDWVEIEELGEAPAPAPIASNGAPPATNAARPEAPAQSEQIRRPAPAATVGDELQVLVALHKMGADLGDPIEVKREGGEILVAGVGLDPERRREIKQALEAKPNVLVRFSDPAAAAAQPEKPVRGEITASADVAALQARMEKQAGGRANYERLATDLLDTSETMMSRAYALRRLAERFPRETETAMTAADRQVLRDLYRGHAVELARQTGALERLLQPVLVPLGGKGGGVSPAVSGAHDAPQPWQNQTEDLFRTARRVETLLAVMLGVAPGETAIADLSSRLLSSLAQLRANAEAYGPAGIEHSEPRP